MADPITSTILGNRSSKKAADAQADASRQSRDAQERMLERQLGLLEPFREAGVDVGLEGLLGLMTQGGRNDFQSDYFNSAEFQTLNNQALSNQLAASEATGGLGSTSTNNQLGRIAPNLGLNALQNQIGQYGNLANMGLSGAGAQGGYIGSAMPQIAGSIGDYGAARAGRHQADAQMWANFGNMSMGALGAMGGGGMGGMGGMGGAGGGGLF